MRPPEDDLDRRGAVVGGEPVAVREPARCRGCSRSRSRRRPDRNRTVRSPWSATLHRFGDALGAMRGSARRSGGGPRGARAPGRGGCRRPDRSARRCEERCGAIGRDFLGDSARNELGQQRMQPTRAPVPSPPRCLLRFANSRNTAACSAGRHRRNSGARIAATATEYPSFGVVLVRPARRQHPDPRRQRRRHIQHLFTRRDELLGEQIAEPASRLDRPRPLPEPCRPANSSLDLSARRPHLDRRRAQPRHHRSRPRCATACADRHRSSPPSNTLPIVNRRRTAVGTPDSGGSTLLAPLSSHTTARSGGSTASFVSQTRTRDGRQFESQPTETPTLRNTATPHADTQSGRYGAVVSPLVGRRKSAKCRARL